QTSVNLAGVMAAVCSHGASALNNALEMASVPMVRPLAKLKKVKDDPKKRRKWLIRIAVVLIGLVVLSFVPWQVKIKCACELTPKHTRVVESGLDGVQIISIEKASGIVQKGEVIALLDDLELKTQLGSLRQELEQERINWRRAVSEVEREYSKLQIDILQNRIDFYTKQIEKCRVTAPISGTILTAQLERKERLTLKKGDPICEIADLTQWQLLLDVPQEEISWVQRGLGDNKQPQVQFFLNAYPKFKLQATMSNVQQISEMPRIKDEGNVYEIRVDVTEEELEDIRNGLRQGLVGRAKIETVHRALGYVLLRKVIRFFRVTFF
ncbi:MAG: HlyD family secretion protein, partial [Sedimentisphaerales bacterium]|nr:HlyD family secretion protein [Sedimentisphaerales bacterium]